MAEGNVSWEEVVPLRLQDEPAVFGARMTGGGFGGSIVALVRRGFAREVAGRVSADYNLRAGVRSSVLIPPTAP